MSNKNCCINCGKLYKYMILILIEIILFFAAIFVKTQSIFFYLERTFTNYSIIEDITSSLGSFLSFILLIIYYIRSKRKNNKTNLLFFKKNDINEISMKKKISWILLVTFISFIIITLNIFSAVKDSYINSFAFYFIFLTFFSKLLLKNKIYKHHYVSIIIIIALDILNNIMAGESIIARPQRYENYREYIEYREYEGFRVYTEDFSFLVILIIYILFYSLKIVLYKYYMLIKYIQVYEILFFEGLFLSVLLIINVILFTNTKIYKNTYAYFDFKYYYKKLNTKEIIIFVSF